MKKIRELVNQLQLADIPLKQGELLCRHTSFRIGGPVSVMLFPEHEGQLQSALRICGEFGVQPLVLGAGTNVLAPDGGLDTVVIETRTNMNRVQDLGGGMISAQAGAALSKVATLAAELGYTGLEFAHGIPGTVGGGVYMNAGAYGGELVQVLHDVSVMSRSGRIEVLPVEELELSYRHSCFMEEDRVILSARFWLAQGDTTEIKAKMTDLMNRRRSSQPLEYPSAGSTFKRPATGYAAALIEQSGLKGFSIGGAQVSAKHAGFVINTGSATAKDVTELMAEVRRIVLEKTGVELEPEVRLMEAKR